MNRRSPRDLWIAVALMAMTIFAIEVTVRAGLLRIPHPSSLSLIPVIYAGFKFGIRIGLICAGLALTYAAYFLSAPGTLFEFAGENATRFAVLIIVTPCLAWMTGGIRARIEREHEGHLRREADLRTQIEGAAAELGRSEQMLRLVTDAVPAMLAFVDSTEHYVYCNQSYLEMSGLTGEQVIGHSVREVMGEEMYRLARPWIEKALRGEAAGFERRRRSPGGEMSDFMVRLVPNVGADGKVLGYSLLMLDITLRKQQIRLEAELLERDRTEAQIARKNLELETLLHVTSHDLKEPLRAIESFSRLVHDRYGDRLDDKGRDFQRRVVNAAQRMNRLLDEILMLAQAQRMGAPTEAIESRSAVREALKRLESAVQESGAKVRVARDLPRLTADPMWATQAVYNLVANALKFTRDGEAPDIEIAPYQENGEIGIVVRDRGAGVSPEHAERIFQLFQRAVGREIEGTGAGLAIVKRVAEQHGGRAWVQPREGGGSEFIITFGAANAAAVNSG